MPTRPYTLRPESFMAPNTFSPYLHVSFRLPYESRDPIFPASNLQLSFAQPSTDQEAFVEPRIAPCDVKHSDTGLCTITLDEKALPRYSRRNSGGEDDDVVLVRLHAWKGERHLGVWEVGRM
ncbi:unnamed protein product [Discula destructiva]